MKIHHIFYSNKRYGGSETMVELISKFSKHEHSIGYAEDVKIEEKLSYKEFYNKLRSYVTIASEKDYDVIHSHFFISGVKAEETRVNSICSSHALLSKEFELAKYDASDVNEYHELVDASNFFKQKELLEYKKIKNLLNHSPYHSEEIKKTKGNSRYIPYPINTSIFHPVEDTNTLKTKLGLENKFTLLFLGRPTYLKGLHVLMDSLRHVKKDIQILLVGEFFKTDSGSVAYRHCVGTESKRDENVVQNSKDKRIITLGTIPHEKVHDIFKASDCIVCPSLYDTAPNVNFEGMACGKPIIGTNTAGIPYFVKHRFNGLLFPYGDSVYLGKMINEISNSSTLCKKLGNNGRKYILKNHEMQKIIGDFDILYDEFMNKN